MRSMGVNVVDHPNGSGKIELYIRICYKYRTKLVRIGPDTRKNRAIANQKALIIRNKIREEGDKILNDFFQIKNPAPTLRQYLGKEQLDVKALKRETQEQKNEREKQDLELGEWARIPGWYAKAQNKYKYSTYNGYVNLIKQRLVPRYGNTRIDKIDRGDFENYLFNLHLQGLKHQTLSNIKNCLSGILTSAVPQWINKNPILGINVPIDKPKEETQETEENDEIIPFSWEEREMFEKIVLSHRPRYYALIATGFRSGLRIGELIGLKVSDLDMVNGIISVRHNVTRGRATTPKSLAGRRKVRMTRELREILSRQITALKEETLKRKWKKVPIWIFVNEHGNKVGYGNFINRVWNPCMSKSKLARKTPHDMRHTYATMRLSMGHSLQEVSKEMGHSTPIVTYKTYYHWMPDMSTSNIDDLDHSKPSTRREKLSSNQD